MVTPWTFTMTSRRERPDPPRSCSRRAPMSTRRVAHRSRPYPPDCGRSMFERRNNAGSSRTPSHPARRTRTIWQCWPVPALSGLLPPTPAPSGAGCPQLHRPATTGSAVAVSHPHSNISASWRTDASIKLSAVASSLTTVSARAMLAAMIAGERDPRVLADLAKGKMRAKIPQLTEALTESFDDHHARMARAILRRLELVEEALVELDDVIAGACRPWAHQLELLQTIPGVGEKVAQVILAETGGDMSRFPSAAHLAAWAGVAPGAHDSAGKKHPVASRHGNKWLTSMLVEAAGSVGRMKGANYLAAQHARLTTRRGMGRTQVAVAHSILVSAYWMLTRDEPYRDLGPDWLARRNDEAHTLNRPGFGAASFFEKDVDHAREEVPGRAAGTGAADGDGPVRGVPDALCLREGAGAEAGGRCRDVAEVDLAGAGRLR